MIENAFSYFCQHAHYAHLIFFGLLLLAGINIPVSEDLILISGGVVISVCIPENYWVMLIWLYVGCLISAYEAYCLGRFLGPRIITLPLFRHVLTRPRIARVHYYIEHFGVFSFIVGRFVPGGVRQCLFITSGLGGMPFVRFALRDACAAVVSTGTLFQCGFLFGEHYHVLFYYFKQWERLVFVGLALIGLSIGLGYLWRHRKTRIHP